MNAETQRDAEETASTARHSLREAPGSERPLKAKPISLSEARKIFQTIAPDAKTCEARACKSLERARYWNWFRIGIAVAQRGRVTKPDVRLVNQSPWLTDENEQALLTMMGRMGRMEQMTDAQTRHGTH